MVVDEILDWETTGTFGNVDVTSSGEDHDRSATQPWDYGGVVCAGVGHGLATAGWRASQSGALGDVIDDWSDVCLFDVSVGCADPCEVVAVFGCDHSGELVTGDGCVVCRGLQFDSGDTHVAASDFFRRADGFECVFTDESVDWRIAALHECGV